MNTVDEEEKTALHHVAVKNEVAIAKVSDQARADVDAVDLKKSTALTTQLGKGMLTLRKVLIKNGCDLSVHCENDDRTAIHTAAQLDTIML